MKIFKYIFVLTLGFGSAEKKCKNEEKLQIDFICTPLKIIFCDQKPFGFDTVKYYYNLLSINN